MELLLSPNVHCTGAMGLIYGRSCFARSFVLSSYAAGKYQSSALEVKRIISRKQSCFDVLDRRSLTTSEF